MQADVGARHLRLVVGHDARVEVRGGEAGAQLRRHPVQAAAGRGTRARGGHEFRPGC